MPWKNEYRSGVVETLDGDRFVRIPKDFILEGVEITICQQKDGIIAIHPATEEGRKALESFNPFGDWTEEDFKKAGNTGMAECHEGALREKKGRVMTQELGTSVIRDPAIMFGKPTIQGTRLTVEHVLRRIAAGWTIEDLLDQHPHLTREGIQAAALFAADIVRDTHDGRAYDAAE